MLFEIETISIWKHVDHHPTFKDAKVNASANVAEFLKFPMASGVRIRRGIALRPDENGNAPPITQVVEGVETIIAPATTEEKAQRRLELKERSTLLMGIPNEQQLKFNSLKYTKSLLHAVEKMFGGNAATKKTQRNLLKQQYENFTASSSEVLNQTFDRLQKLISQLEIHGESISQEEVNQKFLRSGVLQLPQKGHFARECRASRSQDTKHKESIRRFVPMETPVSAALVSCDGLGGYDWCDQAEDGLTNFAPMAYSFISFNSE
nr:hypothetical protein [Tanacetum cinerariifolium]